MKKMLIILCSLFIAIFVVSCSNDNEDDEYYVTIYGTVIDEETKEPIVKASVVLLFGASADTATDTNGHYEFKGLSPKPTKEYYIQVQASGYKGEHKSIQQDQVKPGISIPQNFQLTKK